MSEQRLSVAHMSARIIGGLVIAAGATLAVAAAVMVPIGESTQSRPAVTAQPAPGTTLLGCSGPILAIGRDATNAQALSVAATVTYLTSEPPGLRDEAIALENIADVTATMFAVDPVDGEHIAASAAGSARVAAPDLAGFAAYACQPAAMQSWIVGADATTGTTGIVTLTNPGEVTATVDITVYGVAGPQSVPGSSGIVVAAKSTVAVDLASLAGDELGPVLRVDAHDTPVLVNLQSGLVRTLVTGGVDVQSAVAAPTLTQVVAGIEVSDAGNGAMEFQRARLLSPETTTTARVALRTVGATEDAFLTTVALEGGIPADVELPALPAGSYVMTVTALQPVVAGVWSTTGYQGGSDFAWATAAPALSVGQTPFTVADGESASVTLANAGDTAAQVAVSTSRGEREYTIEPGSAVSIAVASLTNGTITVNSANVHAAVSYAGAHAIASYPIWPADAAAPPVVVRQ